MATSFSYLDYLDQVARDDIAYLMVKDKSYGGSWKKRGGIGAFMMLARKWDRLENILADGYDIFKAIKIAPSGEDGTVLAEVRDLRRYLMLVEAEMMSNGVVRGCPSGKPGTPEDGGHHAHYRDGKMEIERRQEQTPSCSGDTR